MTLEQFAIGQRIYNHGDRANASHFGTVTAIRAGQLEITPDADAELGAYFVHPMGCSEEFLGHGGTRFVLAAAYHRYRIARQRFDAAERRTARVEVAK